MKKFKGILFIFVLLIGTSVFAETYKDWQPYKDYLKLGPGYRSAAMDKTYKDSYEAEQIVKNLPCSRGGTLDLYFSKNRHPQLKDLGWNEYSAENGVDVVREFLGQTTILEYRWHVNPSGKVTPLDSAAFSITSHQDSVAIPYTKPEPPKPLYSVDAKDEMSSEKIEMLLCGSWKVFDRKVTYYPDGTYTEKGVTYKLEGKWRVEDGAIYHSVEHSVGAYDHTPLRIQIVEIDHKKAVFKKDDGTAFTGFRVY